MAVNGPSPVRGSRHGGATSRLPPPLSPGALRHGGANLPRKPGPSHTAWRPNSRASFVLDRAALRTPLRARIIAVPHGDSRNRKRRAPSDRGIPA